MVFTSNFSMTWEEVNKSNPSPLFQKPDWCYLAENQEAVVCGRTDSGEQPQGWRYVKEAEDGRSIFAIEKERVGEASPGENRFFPVAVPSRLSRKPNLLKLPLYLQKISN